MKKITCNKLKKTQTLICLALLVSMTFFGCKKKEDNNTLVIDISGLFEYVNVFEEEGQFIAQNFPDSSGGAEKPVIYEITGKQIIAETEQDVIDTIITSSKNLSSVFVALENYGGYFAIPLTRLASPADTAYTFPLKLKSKSEINYYFLAFAVADSNNRVSERDTMKILTSEGSLQNLSVELSWETGNYVDLDLLLVEPNGDTIYYDNEQSDNDGKLIQDSNGACWLDSANTEIIEYGKYAFAQAGKYTVKTQLYDTCSGSYPVNYTVNVYLGDEELFLDTLTSTYSGVLDTSVHVGDITTAGIFTIKSDY